MEPTQENKTDTAQHAQAKAAFADTGLFNALSGVVAVTSGVLGAWYAAARNFNNRTLKTSGLIRDLESARDTALGNIGRTALGETPKVLPKELQALGISSDKPEINKAVKEIWSKYHGAKNTRLKEKGIDSWFKKWEMIDGHGKTEAIVVASAAASVAIGAMITFSGLSKQSTRQEELQQRLDALDAQHR